MALFKKDPLQIITFSSYGTPTHLYIRGRALEDENIDLTKRGFFSLLRNTWKRFETDEIAHTKLKIKLPNDTFLYVTTDKKGYFKLKAEVPNLNDLTNSEGWLQYEISYEDPQPGRVINNDNRFAGEMLIPSETSKFGVCSDIDDTILHTGVTSFLKLKLVFNTFFKNVMKRSPLEGAASFYQLLHLGKTGEDANPIFYVSHSPWNLYRYLALFLKEQTFPKGPVLLRDFPKPFSKKDSSEKPQKQKEIIDILTTYPNMQFILIGDSGEHDADIYIEIAEAFPKRIKAIYLRSVKHKKKMLRIQGIFDSYNKVPTLLVKSSEEAIEHATAQEFIAAPKL
ncbi:App1 family protein [Cochleicola gelatinilyticus]|uniref:Phosphatidate phosphatase APP1 catalytic domain-containing protein n=1 Tax=Cochleicola gelatinilyticus TaxID=1763537 RepID=A0A167EY32_9FLAO|nr:phosphatase domain-containing protein [Cochleicola gelatinilyticus]OAB75995.1 hypothetical protein ULVI_13090 [Cochleicola gelatinilyticus]